MPDLDVWGDRRGAPLAPPRRRRRALRESYLDHLESTVTAQLPGAAGSRPLAGLWGRCSMPATAPPRPTPASCSSAWGAAVTRHRQVEDDDIRMGFRGPLERLFAGRRLGRHLHASPLQ